jgi:hypothetical protein
MNPELREHLRHNLLLQMSALGRWGVTEKNLAIGARDYIRAITADDIAAAIEYLRGKGLVEAVEKTVSPENRRWKLTAAGTDYIAENLA